MTAACLAGAFIAFFAGWLLQFNTGPFRPRWNAFEELARRALHALAGLLVVLAVALR